MLGQILIESELCKLRKSLIRHSVSVFDEVNDLGVDVVVSDDSGKLREVPGEPFLQPHAESVDVFVELLDEGDGLDDGFVVPVNILGASVSRVGVSETELSSLDLIILQLLQNLVEVHSTSSDQLSDGLVVRSSDASL